MIRRLISMLLLGLSLPTGSALAQTHWAFRPVARSWTPEVTGRTDPALNHPLDRLVVSKLRPLGLSLAPEADRASLLRRLSLDLTGLPPTASQIRRYMEDVRPEAYEHAVDALLASPGFGERWAQLWLDVARFAESDGFEHDQPRSDAWRYRDWVIEALNADMPFDRFVQWQVAGDLLAPEHTAARVATGFLFAGPDMPDINLRAERRHTVLNEMTSTVGAAILGLSVGCAQCHGHKFDPISLREFYQLRAFFHNAAIPKRFQQLPPHFEASQETLPEPTTMIRGDFRRPGSVTPPGFLAALGAVDLEVDPSEPMDRRHLAWWLTASDNPLTGRVAVNRLWMALMGRPLVATPNDFGTQGARPTHPELLDWLAAEWERLGWSWKSMVKRIVLSRAYRQTSVGDGEPWRARIAADPENTLYSRAHRKRMTGEMARDAMLVASGRLNETAGGPGFRPPLPPEVTVTLLRGQWPVTEDVQEWNRRSIYLFARRNLRYPFFEVMDRPDALESCGRRHESTIAPQALTFLNSPFVLEQADDLAMTVAPAIEAGDLDHGIEEAFLRAWGRWPTDEEWRACRAFFDEISLDSTEEDGLSAALAAFCHALLNTNAFVYYD